MHGSDCVTAYYDTFDILHSSRNYCVIIVFCLYTSQIFVFSVRTVFERELDAVNAFSDVWFNVQQND